MCLPTNRSKSHSIQVVKVGSGDTFATTANVLELVVPFSSCGMDTTPQTNPDSHCHREHRKEMKGMRNYTECIMVLKLRQDEFVIAGGVDVQRLERMCYNTFGRANQTYYGGDTRSWQRYTYQSPVSGDLQIKTMNPPTVSFRQHNLLAPGWYGISLLHTVGTKENYINDDVLLPLHVRSTQQQHQQQHVGTNNTQSEVVTLPHRLAR